MYADFEYYTTEYEGDVFKSASAFQLYERKAERRVDMITGNKLIFAFPVNERQVQAVKDCICEVSEFLCQIDKYKQAAMDSVGAVEQLNGTVTGRVIKSVTSGSESVTYSMTGDATTEVMEAAKDRQVFDKTVYSIIQVNLSGIEDANGINLLYAGPYPGKRYM